MGKLEGKVAVVTGGAASIGKAISTAFVAEGAVVCLADRDAKALAETEEELTQAGARVLALQCDVGDPADRERIVRETVGKFGGIDVLVNNAQGIPRQVELETVSEKEWDLAFRTGPTAAFHLMQLSFPYLRERRGRVINVTSAAAIRGIAGSAAYGSAKGAVIGLTRVAAVEWAPSGINVNAFSPFAMSDGWRDYVNSLPEDQRDDPAGALNVHLPVSGRIGDPALDVAPVAVFLASEDSRFITGHVMPIDGGQIELGA